MKQGLYPMPFPSCAVELLAAARSVVFRHTSANLKNLEYAIERFEAEMPVKSDGEIFQINPIPHEEREVIE